MKEKTKKAVIGSKRKSTNVTNAVETPSKELQIAEAFYYATSFPKFIQLMKSIHGKLFWIDQTEHKEIVKLFFMNGLQDPVSLLEAHALLLQKKLKKPARVRMLIMKLFNMVN